MYKPQRQKGTGTEKEAKRSSEMAQSSVWQTDFSAAS